MWYAGHFTHDESSGEEVSHIVGPDLVPTPNIGRLEAVEGAVALIRAHDVGSRYGPPDEQLDVEGVVQLENNPQMAYGLQLRNDRDGRANKAMFEILRDAFTANEAVRIEYTRTGNHSGQIMRAVRVS